MRKDVANYTERCLSAVEEYTGDPNEAFNRVGSIIEDVDPRTAKAVRYDLVRRILEPVLDTLNNDFGDEGMRDLLTGQHVLSRPFAGTERSSSTIVEGSSGVLNRCVRPSVFNAVSGADRNTRVALLAAEAVPYGFPELFKKVVDVTLF